MKNSTLTKISIHNLEYYTYHGVKDDEKRLGGKYQVDFDYYYDAKNALLEDNINLAIDYEEIIFVISEILLGDTINLVETIANECLNTIFDKFEEIQKATIRIRKINVPLRRIVNHIEVEQSMERFKN